MERGRVGSIPRSEANDLGLSGRLQPYLLQDLHLAMMKNLRGHSRLIFPWGGRRCRIWLLNTKDAESRSLYLCLWLCTSAVTPGCGVYSGPPSCRGNSAGAQKDQARQPVPCLSPACPTA